VVVDARGDALYFSRALIPAGKPGAPPPAAFLRHIGMYAFAPAFLAPMVALPDSPLQVDHARPLPRSLPRPLCPLAAPLRGAGRERLTQRDGREWLKVRAGAQRAEDLEQLRALSAGFKIAVARVAAASPDVNTPEDLAALERALATAPSA